MWWIYLYSIFDNVVIGLQIFNIYTFLFLFFVMINKVEITKCEHVGSRPSPTYSDIGGVVIILRLLNMYIQIVS